MVSFKEEKKFWNKGYALVVGLDEAGRGPLAGPVVASAVVVKNPKYAQKLLKQFVGVKDSKKMPEYQREAFFELITTSELLDVGIGIVSEKVIDKMNILKATKLAMKKALEELMKKYSNIHCLILDGNFILDNIDNAIIQKPIIKADEKVFSCVLAGIAAKVTRDRMMKKAHIKYPQYDFDRHKGYGTKAHLEKIKQFGVCIIHRKTFEPIKSTVYDNH